MSYFGENNSVGGDSDVGDDKYSVGGDSDIDDDKYSVDGENDMIKPSSKFKGVDVADDAEPDTDDDENENVSGDDEDGDGDGDDEVPDSDGDDAVPGSDDDMKGDDNDIEDEDNHDEENKNNSSKKTIKNTLHNVNTITNNQILIDDDDDEDDDYDMYLQKFDQEINNNYINQFHPECLIHNSDEIDKLSNVIRDENNIIVDPLHKTNPYLTKYERTRVLGQRAKQIETGANPFVKVPENIIDSLIIAELELKEKKIPFIIKRPIPGGAFEYWKLKDLEIIHY
jgi:DNA-directed RNA polymerase I, II, and III subunit RPABC2